MSVELGIEFGAREDYRVRVYFIQCVFESDTIKHPYVLSMDNTVKMLRLFMDKKIYSFSRWELGFLQNAVLKRAKTDSYTHQSYVIMTPLQVMYLEVIMQDIAEFLYHQQNNETYNKWLTHLLGSSIKNRYVTIDYDEEHDQSSQVVMSEEEADELREDLEELKELEEME